MPFLTKGTNLGLVLTFGTFYSNVNLDFLARPCNLQSREDTVVYSTICILSENVLL